MDKEHLAVTPTFQTSIVVQTSEGHRRVPVDVDEYFAGPPPEGTASRLLEKHYSDISYSAIKEHQRRGINTSGIVRIVFTRDLPKGAEMLLTRNEKLWEKLRRKDVSFLKKGWICYEDEECKCSWCEYFDPIIIIGEAD